MTSANHQGVRDDILSVGEPAIVISLHLFAPSVHQDHLAARSHLDGQLISNNIIPCPEDDSRGTLSHFVNGNMLLHITRLESGHHFSRWLIAWVVAYKLFFPPTGAPVLRGGLPVRVCNDINCFHLLSCSIHLLRRGSSHDELPMVGTNLHINYGLLLSLVIYKVVFFSSFGGSFVSALPPRIYLILNLVAYGVCIFWGILQKIVQLVTFPGYIFLVVQAGDYLFVVLPVLLLSIRVVEPQSMIMNPLSLRRHSLICLFSYPVHRYRCPGLVPI